MHLFKDKFGRNIRLTDERLQHIIVDHPELLKPVDKIEETLMFPSTVIKSEDGEGFVITAFYVKNLQKGEVIWKA